MATDDIDDPEDLDSLHKNGTPNGHTPPHSNGFPAPVHHHIHHHSNSSSDNTPPNFMDLDDDRENKDIGTRLLSMNSVVFTDCATLLIKGHLFFPSFYVFFALYAISNI